MKYMTCRVEIEHPIGRSCDLGKLNGILLEFGEDGKLGKGGHMENLEHPNFNWLDFLDDLVTLEG